MWLRMYVWSRGSITSPGATISGAAQRGVFIFYTKRNI